jgi:hypothetical protein
MPSAILSRISGISGKASNQIDATLLWLMQKLSGKKSENTVFLPRDFREFKKCMYRIFIAIVAIIFCFVVIFVAVADPNAMSKKYYLYVGLIMISIIVGFAMSLPILNESVKGTTGIALILTGLFIILGVYFFFLHVNPGSVKYMSYIMFTIFFAIIFVCLAIFYKIISRYISNMRGWGGFVAKLIMFLPCLAGETVEYLYNDYQKLKMSGRSSNVVLMAFVLFIGTILLFVYLPNLSGMFTTFNGKKAENFESNDEPKNNTQFMFWAPFIPSTKTNQLLGNPVYLNTLTKIAYNDTFRMDIEKGTAVSDLTLLTPDPEESFRKNYGISMWINVSNSYRTTARGSPIFYYGTLDASKPNFNAHPSITYVNSQTQKDTLVVYLSNNDPSAKVTIPIPGQKWCCIGVNYDGNKCDVFLDGHLVESFVFDQENTKLPSYNTTDVMAVGWESTDSMGQPMLDGLHGAICNVNYYKTPFTQRHIANHYNLYMHRNPPN